MQKLQTKTELRRVLGFFSFFREHIPDFARIVKPLTDLTFKKVPNKLPWNVVDDVAFNLLKHELCQATKSSLQIVDFDKGLIYLSMLMSKPVGMYLHKLTVWGLTTL